ncbi:MAG: phytoene desaturase [Acidobacteria bacterium]|jgi:phytoene desaturase|nr:MAG: phytoene desaturase [Acidobacteriota bacterium]GIU82745.1 MAG: phytoene desaturase [Pyrinomonadaceae bacterium]
MKSAIVIGAGLGGLAVACRLAKMGLAVTIFEKNELVGGKVNLVEAAGYKFDTGASLLTMRHVLEDLFNFCSRHIEDYLELVELDPICRYFWSDGTVFDASRNLEKTEAEIRKLNPKDVSAFRAYLSDAKQKYEIAERTFLAKSLNELPEILTKFDGEFLKNLRDLLRLSSLRTLDAHNSKFFSSPKLRQLFNRFATYNGSSPYEIPATFALIPYVEFGLGAWYVKGGIYEIPKSLARLASELGVRIFSGVEVDKIIIKNQKAVGVQIGEESFGADFIISNADAVETYRRLLGVENKFVRRQPSCSGFVILLGVKKQFPKLAHHNIFFSDDYKAEFDAIFKQTKLAQNPTIYVCATSRTDATQAPPNCENLFILVNAPYLTDKVDWEKEGKDYRNLIIRKLEDSGLEGLEESIEFEKIITPLDFARDTNANRGSIYGISSNGIFSAFLRVPNKCREFENLYFVGGAAHPGGGIPLVLLSAKMVADTIIKNL